MNHFFAYPIVMTATTSNNFFIARFKTAVGPLQKMYSAMRKDAFTMHSLAMIFTWLSKMHVCAHDNKQ